MPHFVIPSCAPCLLEAGFQVLYKANGIPSDQSIGRDHPKFNQFMKATQEFLDILQNFGDKSFPALIASDLLRAVKQITGNSDPYKVEREDSNRICLHFYDKLKSDLSKLETTKIRL